MGEVGFEPWSPGTKSQVPFSLNQSKHAGIYNSNAIVCCFTLVSQVVQNAMDLELEVI